MKRLLLALLLLTLTLPATAQSVVGNWRSSTGSSVNIQDHGQALTVTITSANGQNRSQWGGRWLRAGNLFEYQTNEGARTCQVINGNTIQITLPGGQIVTWNRVQSGFAHFGLWQSSSGNKIRISNSNGQLVINVFYKNGQTGSFPGRIVNSNEFTYSSPNTGSSFVCKGIGQGRISCRNTVRGLTTTWSYLGK